MDVIQLLRDHNIQFATEGQKHCRPGWVNMSCPFCVGNPGYHLGLTLEGSHFYCWRCGYKSTELGFSKILNVNETKVREILREYKGISSKKKQPLIKINRKAHKMPTGVIPLQKQHIKYLEKRKFDIEYLQDVWYVQGTNPVSLLDGVDYSHRIIAPVYWQGRQVTFQARDITNKHKLKYMACPKEREIIHHKHILYGKQEGWSDVGICVEGITDAWRLGVKSFCVFGIEFTHRQIRQIVKQFKRVFILFDEDPQAILQAEKLKFELEFRGVQVEVIEMKDDPASMLQADADYLVKYLTEK